MSKSKSAVSKPAAKPTPAPVIGSTDDFPVIETTQVFTDADAEAQAEKYAPLLGVDEPVVSGEFPEVPPQPDVSNDFVAEGCEKFDEQAHPTVAEARAMFSDRPGLSQVLTDEGLLNRDGSISGPPVVKKLTLSGTYVEASE